MNTEETFNIGDIVYLKSFPETTYILIGTIHSTISGKDFELAKCQYHEGKNEKAMKFSIGTPFSNLVKVIE